MKKESLKDKDYFKTSDISLCATLCCFNYHIEAINKQNPKRAVFLLKKDEKIDDLIKQYWTHRLKVEPMSFFNSLKEIKTRIYSRE